MLIGLISDTHDHVPHIKKAVNLFKKRDVDLVLHAGDYCSPFTIPHFSGLPVKGILGNNDGDHYLLMQKFREVGIALEGGFMDIEAGGRSIALYHGTYGGITEALRSCGTYDVVVTGHTHEKLRKEFDGTLAINPGTANGFDGEATISFLETDTLDVEFVALK